MDKKTTSWVSYVTFIGWIIAYCAGDKEGAKFHLNQSLVIWLVSIGCSIILVIPFIGWIIGTIGLVFTLVCWVMGLISAINQEEKEVPLIGQWKILK